MRSKMTREERVKEREKLKEAKSMFYSEGGGGGVRNRLHSVSPHIPPTFFLIN